MTKYTQAYSLKGTPQTKPAKGREKEQVKNLAGGYTFKAGDWERLERFLKLGSEGGTYYLGERALTIQNAEVVMRCLNDDGILTVDEIVRISTNKLNVKQDPVLFALSLACSIKHGNKKDTSDPKDKLRLTREYAFDKALEVVRTGSHLLSFISMLDSNRGWGAGMRRFVKKWTERNGHVNPYVFQALKYQNRAKWWQRDILRMGHPKPVTDEFNLAFKYVTHREKMSIGDMNSAPGIINPVEQVRSAAADKDMSRVHKLIVENNLPREVIPTELLNEPLVWLALVKKMPPMATLRNLGKMTSLGLFEDQEVLDLVTERLTNQELLVEKGVHPINILIGLRQYEQGHSEYKDESGKNRVTWTPLNKITKALDDAFYLAFGAVKPTGLKTEIWVDVSGSMHGTACAGKSNLEAHEASAALAMMFLRTEDNAKVRAFDDKAHTPKFGNESRLAQMVESFARMGGGGTDCSIPFTNALREKRKVDLFIMVTDSETWAGRIHSFEALNEYRKKVNEGAYCVVVSVAANYAQVGDPNDPRGLQVCGFDGSVPTAIRAFVGTEKPMTDEED